MNDPTVVAGAGDTAAAPDLQFPADDMAQAIGLESAPVAVFLLSPDADMAPFAGWEAVERHRYCQALMKARAGEWVILEADELVCPAAGKAFGFRPLAPALQTGKGLGGFGVDATIIPRLEQRLIFTMGCHGCREATDLQPAETVVGFPGARLAQLVDSLAFLSEKAVPRSRAKRAHQSLVDGRAPIPDAPSLSDRRAE